MNFGKQRLYKLISGILMVGLVFGTSSCFRSPDHPEGLALAGGGTGPMVVFDPLHRPIPEIPFPNDIATVLDDTTITGRRINISTDHSVAPTELEKSIRRTFNTMDGWGTYSAISLKFDQPLDLSTVNESNILVIKLTGPDKGKTAPLDLGKGFFPTIWRPYGANSNPWWHHDPYNLANNLLFSPFNVESGDENGNGVPNEFLDYYEKETNSLIIRPIIPLDEASRYAVVLLNGMTGLPVDVDGDTVPDISGQPIRSAFRYINHTMQTDDLQPLLPILQGLGIPLDRVAFTWSFTTQSISAEWINIWEGLVNGQGPLSNLYWEYPPVITSLDMGINIDGDGLPYAINADWFEPIIKTIATFLGEDDYVEIADFRFTDYFVFGTFQSPSFFDGLDFGNPLFAPPHSWDPARLSGAVPTDQLEVPFMLSVPRDEDLGLDGCQNTLHALEKVVRPQGCTDFEEAGAKGPDGEFGFVNVDDNGDTVLDDEGEYLWPGSDDVADPAGDNYDPVSNPTGTEGNGILDMDLGPDGVPGCIGDDDGNGIIDDITEFGWAGCDDGLTEDANQDGRLNTPPFPVSFYGHGHTSGAVESLGFAGPMNQFGIALFGMDNFGHGPFADFADIEKEVANFFENDLGWDVTEVCNAASPTPNCYTGAGGENIFDVLDLFGVDLNGDLIVDWNDIDGMSIDDIIKGIFDLGLFRVLSSVGRGYDVDGDTLPDSGDIFWTANIFQTRDLVRQTAVDWFQFCRIADLFGTMANFDYNGDTVMDLDGDYNADGRYDLGGDTSINTRGHYMFGSSLGGIMGVLNAGVNPRMVAVAPVAGAGGLPEVIPRSHQGSANTPVMRQIVGPVIVGIYENVPGRVKLAFFKDKKDDYIISDPFGYLYLPPFGRIQVNNLTNGETRIITGSEVIYNIAGQGVFNPDAFGNFSINIPADAGDLLEIISLDDNSGPTQSRVLVYSVYQGIGLKRNDPDLRRFIALAQWAIERGDAINFAKNYFNNSLGTTLPGHPEKGILLINTTGDPNVPINTGNAIASAAGLWTMDDAKYLIARGINLGYTPPPYGSPLTDCAIFDPEDLDDDGLECGWDFALDSDCNPTPISDWRCDLDGDTNPDPGIAPLPVVPSMDGKRVSAVRWPYVNVKGHHAFALPGAINHGIDWGIYMANQIGFYFASDGSCIIDDPWELYASEHVRPGLNGILDGLAGLDQGPGVAGVDDDGDTIIDNCTEYTMGDDNAILGDDKIREIRVMKTLGLNPCDYDFPKICILTAGPDYTLQSTGTMSADDVLISYDKMNRGPLEKQ